MPTGRQVGRQAGTYDERKSFLIFIVLVLFTALIVTLGQESYSALGPMGVLWGAFGFFRLIHLSASQYKNLPKILSLPSQILFGLAKKQEERISLTLKRLGRFDVVFWVFGSVAFVLLALFFSFSPSEISVVKTLHLKQEVLVDFPIQNKTNLFAMMEGLSFYGIAGIIIYSALSFSQSHTNIRWAIYSIIPVFFVVSVFVLMFSSVAYPTLWPALGVLAGGGLGQAHIMDLLLPKMMQGSGTGLLRRFSELGMIGAYGVYVLFLPAFITLMRTFFNRRRTFLKPLIGLLCFVFLAMLDIFWISAPIIHSVMIIGVMLSSLCWGAAASRS